MTDNPDASPAAGARRSIPTVSVIIGLASLMCWQDAIISFMFPSSPGHVLSPVSALDLASLALIALCWISYRRDSPHAFSLKWYIGLVVLGTLSGTLGGGLVANTLLPLWGIYLAAIIGGFSIAALTYAWGLRLLALPPDRVFPIAFAALMISGIVEASGMYTAVVPIPLLLALYALMCCICFAWSARGLERDSGPLLFRPVQTADYLKLAIGLVVLAGALGITTGTTADVCTEDSMRDLDLLIASDTALLGAITLAIWAISRRRFGLMPMMRLAPTLLLITILLNIAISSLSTLWLSITFLGWAVVRLLVMLFVIEMSRKRIISFQLVFPIAWAVLMCGHAAGIICGQTILPDVATDITGVQNIIILIAILVVCATMFILGNRLVIGLMLANPTSDPSTQSVQDGSATASQAVRTQAEGDGAARDGASKTAKAPADTPPACVLSTDIPSADVPSAAAPADVPPADIPSAAAPADAVLADDPLETRCHAIARRNRFSPREEEVFILLARGHTRANIAKRLVISENTVRAHVKNIYSKLHIHSKQQLIDMVDRP